MTLPNGISGISDAIGTLFATTGDRSQLTGWGINFIPDMQNLNQEFVTDLLKANVIQASTAWNNATAMLWDGLRRGDPIHGAVSIILAQTEAIVKRLFPGISINFGSLSEALDAIEPVALLEDFVNLIGVLGQGLGALTTASTPEDVLAALQHTFEGIDMTVEAPIKTFIDDLIATIPGAQDVIDAICNALGLPGTGHHASDIITALTHIPTANIPDLLTLIANAIGLGGSSFPWNFPLGFGSGTNTLADVGTAIANSDNLAQQLLDSVVQQYTGSASTGNSIQQFQTALQQQPGSTLGTTLPSVLLPDITSEMSTGIQVVQQDASAALSQLNDVLAYAKQESAQALGSFVFDASQVANLANVFSQGTSDQIVSALAGFPVIGSGLVDLYTAFTGHLTGLYNGWTGSNVTQADSTQVTAAAQQAASQANQQSALINSIQTQLPHFYGGGSNGLSFQQLFSGTMPSGFTALTPGSSVAYQVAINTAQQCTSDTQAVSGVWTVQDNYAKLLILRSNLAGTTFTYALIQSNSSTNNCKIGCVVGGVNTVLSTFGLPGNGLFVANYSYTFQAVGRVLTLSGPNGLSKTVTDSGNVGSIGSGFRYGGFGTNGTSLGASGWGTPGDYTFTPPAGMVAGDQYEIVPLGAAGGAGGGINAWGNGGGVGHFASLLATLGVTGGPAIGAPISVHVGAGGAAGNSGYYRTTQIEYYSFGGSAVISDTTYLNYANPGGPGGNSNASYSKIGGGTQTVIGTGGTGGAASGGGQSGGGGATTELNGDTFGTGGAQLNATLINGSAPAYSGYDGNNFGGGGSASYSGSGQTSVQDWYDFAGDHFYGYTYGVNAQQNAGAGAPGAVWITPISRQLPGSIASWAFYDAAVAGPVSSPNVGTFEGTTRTGTYGNLATTTDQVTVNIGPSGMCLVFISAYAQNNTDGGQMWMSYSMTGANALNPGFGAGTVNYEIGAQNPTLGSPYTPPVYQLTGTMLHTGLAQGATTFKLKYGFVGVASTASYGERVIVVIPL